MAAAAGILNQQLTAGQALTGRLATPMDNSTSGTNGSGTNGANGSSNASATISANDFLTLLVTEMQNQDPTTATDPNQYINQLVEVNSLEQLVQINQTLTADSEAASSQDGSASSQVARAKPAGTSPLGTAVHATPGAHGATAPGAATPVLADDPANIRSAAFQRVFGNLGAPHTNPAAERVAHALDGRTHAPVMGSVPVTH